MRSLAEACDRYHISDRAGAAIASAVLVDFGMIIPGETQSVIDENKLRRERAKFKNETKKNEKLFFEKIDGIGFDGRLDVTLAVDKINENHFNFKILEDKLVLIKLMAPTLILDTTEVQLDG